MEGDGREGEGKGGQGREGEGRGGGREGRGGGREGRVGAWGREERGGGDEGEVKGRGLVPLHMTCLHDAPVYMGCDWYSMQDADCTLYLGTRG